MNPFQNGTNMFWYELFKTLVFGSFGLPEFQYLSGVFSFQSGTYSFRSGMDSYNTVPE